MRLTTICNFGVAFLTGAAVSKAVLEEKPAGNVWGIPYDFTPPTPTKIKRCFWNREDERIFTPHIFGVGWSVNLYQVGKRIGLVYEEEPSTEA